MASPPPASRHKLVHFSLGLLLVGSATSAENLIVNPGGEAPTGGTANGVTVLSIPGWTTTGNATLVAYGTSSYPSSSSPGPPLRGANLFCGGRTSSSTALSQTVDVSQHGALISAGVFTFTVAGYFGGWTSSGGVSQDDNARLDVTFLAAGGSPISSTTIGPVMPADRGNVTGLALRTATGNVPPLTRSIRFSLVFTFFVGNDNDGYADNLSFTLNPKRDPLVPQVEIACQSNQARLRWFGESIGQYQLQVSTGITGWQNLGVLRTAANSMLEYIDEPLQPRRFYRIVVTPAP